MSTEFYNRNWRMANSFNGSEDNNSKFSNYSMSFDGSSEYINCGTDIGTSFGEDYTGAMAISIWFKTDITSGDDGILQFTGSTSLGEISAAIYANDLEIRIKGGLEASGSFTDTSNWHHLVINLLGPSAANQVYLDGVAFGSNFTYNGGGLDLNGETFNIGHYGGSRYFNGKLDHCCIFDYALTQAQITALYGSSSTGVGNPMAITNGRKPVAYYPIGDYSAYNGTEYLVPNSAVSDYVFDFSSGSIEVSATPSQLSLPSTTVSSGGFSISFWYYHNTIVNFDVVMQSTNANANNGFGVWQSTTNNGLNFWVGHYLQGDLYTTNNYFTSQKWYNITCIFEGGATHTSKIFIDGVLNNSVSYTTSRNIHSGENILIGGWPLYSRFFDGKLSNVAILNTALPATGTESIESLYNYGTPPDISSYSGLQGWWKLDASATFDGSNWSIPDDSTNSNTGTSSGMTAANLVQSNLNILSPYSRYALNFDSASSDYIDCGFMPALDAVQQFTISTWVNMPNVSGTKRMIGKRYNSVNNIAFNFASNVLYTTINGAYGSANANFSINTWYNIAMVFDGTLTSNANRLKLYIDGVQQTLSFTGTIPSITYDFSLNPSTFYLGTDGFTTPNYYDGSISNVSIWNAALTSPQVTEIYNNGLPSNLNNHSAYSNLVSWWQLGENSSFNTNWTVIDEKGTSNGVSSNMAEDDLVNGVGTSGNGISSGMSGGDNIVGEAPFSDSNALSINMPVTAKSTSVPS